MCLPGRMKIRIHTKVQSQSPSAKPCAPTRGKIRWFLLFDQPKNTAIERSRRCFLTRGHGQLDVIESENFAHSLVFDQPPPGNRRAGAMLAPSYFELAFLTHVCSRDSRFHCHTPFVTLRGSRFPS